MFILSVEKLTSVKSRFIVHLRPRLVILINVTKLSGKRKIPDYDIRVGFCVWVIFLSVGIGLLSLLPIRKGTRDT